MEEETSALLLQMLRFATVIKYWPAPKGPLQAEDGRIAKCPSSAELPHLNAAVKGCSTIFVVVITDSEVIHLFFTA